MGGGGGPKHEQNVAWPSAPPPPPHTLSQYVHKLYYMGKEILFFKEMFLSDIVVIILHTFCSFGGITINTDVEKCESNEDFERKLACKFIISEGLY